MSYQPSNVVLHVSIFLANLSFAYTLPIITRAFPFHIVTIVAYVLTLVFHTFLLCTGSMQNKALVLKIASSDGQEEERPLLTIRPISPTSIAGILMSFVIAVVWIGSTITRIVFMSIKYRHNATVMGLLLLGLEALTTSYIAVRSIRLGLSRWDIKMEMSDTRPSADSGVSRDRKND